MADEKQETTETKPVVIAVPPASLGAKGS